MTKTNKDFYNWGKIEKKETKEGLIQQLIKSWVFKKQFTKEELEEINKIKRNSFMREFRRLAKEEGEKLAKEEFKRK